MSFQQQPINLRGDQARPGTRAIWFFAGAVSVLALIDALIASQAMVALVGGVAGLGLALSAPALIGHERGRLGLHRQAASLWQKLSVRRALLSLGLVGLVGGLFDLGDLAEPDERLIYPMLQLGLPIVAFLAAVMVGMLAVRSAPAAGSPSAARQQRSLWRAHLALLACGAAALALAELAEHGLPEVHAFYLLISGVISLVLIGGLYRLSATTTPAPRVLPVAPHTLGVRVDGRAQWVDFLEDCMSFGQRRNILAATLASARIAPGLNLLDIGCGTGELVVAAARIIGDDGCARDGYALGVDATPAMIELARQRAEEDRVSARFEVAVAERLPLPDAVIDSVTSSFFFHHLPSAVKSEALREMWRVLKPGGRLVITDYGRPQSLLGYVASFPMRFNFHEHVRGQLGGEVEAVIAAAAIGTPRIARSFLGYINVLVLEKPGR